MKVYLACHRTYPTVTIIHFGETVEGALEEIKKHPDWQEGRFDDKGPWGYKHCLHSFWDNAFDRVYPVFEIHVMAGK